MKQETFYVQITGCSDPNQWYALVAALRPIFFVFVEYGDDSLDFYSLVDYNGYSIFKQDCRRVYLQEQATDIDGEPLVCCDRVIDINNGKHFEYLYKKKSFYFGIEFERNSVYCSNKIRKVKPDPIDPIDPIEELYKNYQGKIDYLASGKYSATTPYEFEVPRDFAVAIKKYIEDKTK